MIEHCCNCGAKIEFSGDPQSIECPKCHIINFRYTWDMCMSPEEIATDRLLICVETWFTDRSWISWYQNTDREKTEREKVLDHLEEFTWLRYKENRIEKSGMEEHCIIRDEILRLKREGKLP